MWSKLLIYLANITLTSLHILHVLSTGFAKSLLDVGDDFERAIQAVPKDGQNAVDSVAVLKTLVEGAMITYCTTLSSNLENLSRPK